MTGIYITERISLLDSLLKKRLDIAGGKPWTVEPRQFRFKHGETIAELKVPYHMGADDEARIEEAIVGLISLLSRRYEPMAEGRKDSAPLLTPVGLLKDKTFRTDLFLSDSLEKDLACSILSTTPYMDSAILVNWLGSEGHGRKFIRWVSDFFEKLLKEEAKLGCEEKTAYLGLMAVINTIRKKKERVKGFRIKGLSYERADLAVGLTIFLTFKAALRALLDRLKAADALFLYPATEALLSSALVPKSFVSIPSNLISTTINPYGINIDTYEALSRHLPDISNDPKDAEAVFKAASECAARSGEALEAIKLQNDINSFREEAFNYLTILDLPGTGAQDLLYELYNEDRLIKNFLSDQRAVANLSAGLEEVKKRFSKDQNRIEIIDSFLRFLSTFKKSMLGSFLKGQSKKAAFIAPVIQGYYACRLDESIERYEGLMRGYLADRRGEYKQNLLVEEYNRGRLYRFSSDERPVLKTLELEEEGQLFIDMKDFSRKTLKVKEIAMADFMREYFYKPILDAASRYGMGMGIGTDERGIRLTNLPGDAAIFSGGVSYLVALAKDIQHIIRRYRDQLTQRLPPRRDEEILDEVHKRFEARKDALKRKRIELNSALENKEPGVESRMVALGEEEHRLENTYRDELEASIKGELEAGLYISYGAKAENMIIETKGEFSGPVNVSIGEKINESARGTFRHPLVRAKLELLLENEKIKRNNKSLRYPFDIYIDRVFSIKMPPELDSAFDKLISTRKPSSAKAMADIMANEYYNDLKKIISGETFSALRVISSTTDIYNKGEALSINALEAYMRETRGTKWFFQKTVNANNLDASIREKLFFPNDTLEFWFSLESVRGVEQIEAFYKSGEVIFRGFETNTPMIVYELLNPEGELFKALVKFHFHEWLEESRRERAVT